MYRMIIVDDEPRIVQWLYELFEREELLDLDIYKAYSAMEVLALMNRFRADIVLADIRMPGMNGLELLHKIRCQWPKCRVIFLTGYSQFEYAYTAIRENCSGFILKTEDDDVIVSEVEKAVRQLDEEMKDNELYEKVKTQIHQEQYYIHRDYLTAVLLGGPAAQLDSTGLSELELPISTDEKILMSVGYLKPLGYQNRSYTDSYRVIHALRLLTCSFLGGRWKYVCFDTFEGLFIILVNPGEELKEFIDVTTDDGDRIDTFFLGDLEIIQKACRESLSYEVNFAATGKSVQFSDIPKKFAELKQLLNFSNSVGEEGIIIDGSLRKSNYKESAQRLIEIEKELPILKNKTEILMSTLDRGEEEVYSSLLKDIASIFNDNCSMSYNPALEVYYNIAVGLLSHINRWELAESLSSRINLLKLFRIDEFKNWKEAYDFLLGLSLEIYKVRNLNKNEAVQEYIDIIQRYIGANIGNDLSLVKLSELVYLNPAYLSRLFKRMTGTNLSDYILFQRVERAKGLLEKSSMKIQDIASKVGFDSTTYFIRVFKRHNGFTPQDYRDELIRSQNRMMG